MNVKRVPKKRARSTISNRSRLTQLDRTLLLLFFVSGATGLVYELVWTRRLILIMGGTTFAVTTVLVAFMSGLALGSYVGGRLIHRTRIPARWYGYLEIGIGLYCLAVPFLFQAAAPFYRIVYGALPDAFFLQSLVRFGVSCLVLLIPTTLMGATLPLLIREFTRDDREVGRRVGICYAINTFGAFVGTLAGGFVLLPWLGLNLATWVTAAVNLMIGLAAVKIAKPITQAENEPAQTDSSSETAEGIVDQLWLRRLVLFSFALSGFCAMIYQVTWTRALVMSIGSSVNAFTSIVATFIFGLALGSAVMARWADHIRHRSFGLGLLQGGIGLSVLMLCPVFGWMPRIVNAILDRHAESYATVVLLEFLVIFLLVLAPTMLMGAMLPLVGRICTTKAEDAGGTIGSAYAVNTIGTICGAFCAGFVLIPSPILGIQNSLVLAAGLNGLIGVVLMFVSFPVSKPVRIGWAAGLIAVCAVVILAGGRWSRDELARGAFLNQPQRIDRILYYQEGLETTVAVTQTDVLRSLRVNGKPDASTGWPDMTTQLLLGHVPMILSPRNRDVLVIGMGSGITLGAITRHSEMARVDCVEISPGVLAAATFFDYFSYSPESDDRVRLIRADGRNHLLLTESTYDVIVSEPSNPWISGISNLFTVDFFRICQQRLNRGGVLCQWVTGTSFSVDDFRMVVRSLMEVFPRVLIWEMGPHDYLLLSGGNEFEGNLGVILRRLEESNVKSNLARVGLDSAAPILARFLAEAAHVSEIDKADLNTDDNAALEFRAPRFLYASEAEQIRAQLVACQADPAAFLRYDQEDSRHREVLSRAARIRSHAGLRSRLDALLGTDTASPSAYEHARELAKSAHESAPLDFEFWSLLRVVMATELKSSQAAQQPERHRFLTNEAVDLPPPPWSVELTVHGGGTKTPFPDASTVTDSTGAQ